MNPIPDSTQRRLSIEHKIDQWGWHDYDAVFSWTVSKLVDELVWYIQTETSPRHKEKAEAMYRVIWEHYNHARSLNDWQDSHSL